MDVVEFLLERPGGFRVVDGEGVVGWEAVRYKILRQLSHFWVATLGGSYNAGAQGVISKPTTLALGCCLSVEGCMSGVGRLGVDGDIPNSTGQIPVSVPMSRTCLISESVMGARASFLLKERRKIRCCISWEFLVSRSSILSGYAGDYQVLFVHSITVLALQSHKREIESIPHDLARSMLSSEISTMSSGPFLLMTYFLPSHLQL